MMSHPFAERPVLARPGRTVQRGVTRNRAGILAMAIVIVAACEGAPAGDLFLGFRGAGAGQFLDDCDPVTKWNEYTWVTEKEHLRWSDKREPVNIVWTQSINMASHANLLLVRGRLFALSERWHAHIRWDTGEAFGFVRGGMGDDVGPRLHCLDPATGNSLWSRELHHLDKLPPDQAKAVKVAAKAHTEAMCRLLPAAWRAEKAAEYYRNAVVNGPSAASQLTDDFSADGMEKADAKAQERAAGVERQYLDARAAYLAIPDAPPGGGPLPADVRKAKGRWNQGCVVPGHEYGGPRVQEWLKTLGDAGYDCPTWTFHEEFIGPTFQTPCSDGERVYVATQHNDVYCYDLGGTQLWNTWFGKTITWCRGGNIASPVLAGDVLLVFWNYSDQQKGDKLHHGIDKVTGRELWRLEDDRSGFYNCIGSPVVMRIPVEGSTNRVPVFVTCSGKVLRPSDGRVLLKDAFHMGRCGTPAVFGDTLYVYHHSSTAMNPDGAPKDGFDTGAAAAAMRITLKGDRETAVREVLWTIKDNVPSSHCATVDEKVLYMPNAMVDRRTGTVIAPMPPRLSVGHQTYRAGKYLFTAGGSVWNVVDVSVNPPRLVTETPNRLGGSFPADHASQMLFSGNRIFVRTYTEVYSLGDPSQPMRLSAVHR